MPDPRRPIPPPRTVTTTGVLISELLGDDDGPHNPYARDWWHNPLTMSPRMVSLLDGRSDD